MASGSVKEDAGRCELSVDDSFVVDECHGLDYVADVVLDAGHFEELLGVDLVKYVVSLEQLHGNVDVFVFGVVKEFEYPRDIWVVELVHDFVFLLELRTVFDGISLDGLDDAFFLGIYMCSLAYFSVSC